MVKCPYCDREPLLVKGDVIYPKRQDLVNNLYWLCKPCDAYVGCHTVIQAGRWGDWPTRN